MRFLLTIPKSAVRTLLSTALTAALFTSYSYAADQKTSSMSPAEAQAIAVDAYVYGYSLITTDITRVQMSNVSAIDMDALRAPAGKFLNVKRYPPADYRGVSAPNADTLYSLAWVDLTEPVVFSYPDMGNRFYLFEMTDLWMIDYNAPGARTSGGAAANYLLTGPNWKGKVPSGMKHIAFPTRKMVILGRIYADGSDADYQKVNAIQAQLKLTPLSSWGKSFTYTAPAVNPNPGFSMTDKPQAVINAMDTTVYFNLLAKLMCKDAPPAPEDKPMLSKMAKIGLKPCMPFNMDKFDSEVQTALKDVGKLGMARIEGNQKNMGRMDNGWSVTIGLGKYGTDYLKRATVAAYGWPANLEKDAVYPYTFVDSTGAKLNGSNKYEVTFAKGQTPPVKGFWSITMYMIDNGWWFVPNSLNKFTVSPRNSLKYNADGSLTLYFQNESPGSDKEANWLPAPQGDFLLMLRMYWPTETSPSILNGSWKIPEIKKVH